MLFGPRLCNFDLIDGLFKASSADDRYSDPLRSSGGLDAIAIVPVALHKLRTVVDHVFVATTDQVEKAPRGDVARLNDGDSHRFALACSVVLPWRPNYPR
jgi:hypothetical protein